MMDCRHAEFLLHFKEADLLPEDRASLAKHIAACPACSARVASLRLTDAALRQSFAQVPVPSATKEKSRQVLLSQYRGLLWRRRTSALSAVAALLLVVAVGLGVRHQLRPTADVADLAYREQQTMERPQETVEQWLAQQKLPLPPVEFNYAYYLEHGVQDVGGVSVPVVTFVRNMPNANHLDKAKLFVFRRQDFHVKQMQNAQASFVAATVYAAQGRDDLVWVIIHTTATPEPFFMLKNREVAVAF